jgi:beta-glucosidase
MNVHQRLEKVAQRAEEILQAMSLEQKVGQVIQTERMCISPEEVREFHIGSILSGGGSAPGNNECTDWVEMNEAYYQASMKGHDGLPKIPTIYGVDAIHGHNNVKGATVFPHNIGLGATRDPDLLKRIAQVTAKEILATGVEWTFAPTLAVARNMHWGRMYESYSEDTNLVKWYAGPFVEGLQGDLGTSSVVACVKHWVGDGGTTYGIDQGDTHLSEGELRDVHMAPYVDAIRAGALTVMASFNSWNGDKCHGHKYLLTDVLKNELQFHGFIISDWDGIDYLSDSYNEAVALGMNAGIDMFMVSENWKGFFYDLKGHVESGRVSMERLDDAVRRILKVKLAYGLFEKPSPKRRAFSNHESFGSDEHRDVAREAVRKSLVLLKNENNLLPLQKTDRILVAGKNADDTGHQCGGFTLAWQGMSDSDKISRAFPEGITTSGYHFGAMGPLGGSIPGGTSIWEGIQKVAPNAELNLDGSKADPAKHDVAVVVIGETPYAEGMGDIRASDDVIVEMGSVIKGLMKVLHPYGTSIELNKLHPEDLMVMARIAEKGIPVVGILISGRPLIINKELQASDAFVAAWLPGSEGQGVADVIFGDHDFQGELSFTWYGDSSEEIIPGKQPKKTLYPFGYGLKYSRQEV